MKSLFIAISLALSATVLAGDIGSPPSTETLQVSELSFTATPMQFDVLVIENHFTTADVIATSAPDGVLVISEKETLFDNPLALVRQDNYRRIRAGSITTSDYDISKDPLETFCLSELSNDRFREVYKTRSFPGYSYQDDWPLC